MRREPDDQRTHHVLVSKTVRDYIERYAKSMHMLKTEAIEQLVVYALMNMGKLMFKDLPEQIQLDYVDPTVRTHKEVDGLRWTDALQPKPPKKELTDEELAQEGEVDELVWT